MKKITLKAPLKISGNEVTTLDIRRPRVADLVDMDKRGKENKEGGEMDQAIFLVSTLAGISEDAVRGMDAEDFMEVIKLVFGWLGKSLPTGAISALTSPSSSAGSSLS